MKDMWNQLWSDVKIFFTAAAMGLMVVLGSSCTLDIQSGDTPDYVMIEFGSIVTFSVIVNETPISDESVLKADQGLALLQETLVSMLKHGDPLDITQADAMLSNALPEEYEALGSAALRLIQHRYAQYAHEALQTEQSKVVKQLLLSVANGARQAMAHKVKAAKARLKGTEYAI